MEKGNLETLCIRQMTLEDVKAFESFIKQLYQESDCLLYDPEEWPRSVNAIKKALMQENGFKKFVIFIAILPSREIVGSSGVTISLLKRFSHVMHVNVGVLARYHGMGIAEQLSLKLADYARANGIERVEASVIHSNYRSINLCKKFGMEVEGI